MATAPDLQRMTYAEYLALERTSEVKHEYVNGEVWAMAGGTPEHGRLAASFIALVRVGLGHRRCAVYSSDVRIRVETTKRSTYPDLSVVCDRVERAKDDPDAITNPRVIVEVLSDSTEADDRGDKWAHYQRVDSLTEYVLVSQREPRVEVFRRSTATGSRGAWVYEEIRAGGRVELRSLDVSIAVDELYADPLRAPE